MPIIDTSTLKPSDNHPANQQIYNGLDCCVTFEVFEELDLLLNNNDALKKRNADPIIYDFERALQAPALEMMLRGFLIDGYEKVKGIKFLQEEIRKVDSVLQEFAFAIWGKSLNPRAPEQLKSFFYDTMQLPEQWISQKGIRKMSMNREVLEKLETYLYARPIIACCLHIRELKKQLEVLLTEVDPDGRMRTSYNIAGTETGRWSSSASSSGTGTNLQNLNPKVRPMFIADKGYKLGGIDLEQAESREVGWLCGILFNDWTYLNACEAGDLHTTTAKLIWRNLPWTGDKKSDRAIADALFYREFSYRDMSKRGGHATNYLVTPWTMSRHLKIPLKLSEDFQSAYNGAYPSISKWQRYVAQELQTKQRLTTSFGRTRLFFGRPNDDTTLREAIAFEPQAMTADRLNLGLWRIWKHMGTRVQILAQVHDALYFQYPEDVDEADIITEALSYISVPITKNGRTFTVPGEAKTGWNWGVYDAARNPNGMKKYTGTDTRTRLDGWNRVL